MRTLATILLLCCSAWTLRAQVPGADTSSSRNDSVSAPIRPIALVGSVDRMLGPEATIGAEELSLRDYRTLADLLGRLPGAFLRDPASVGLGVGLTFRAADQRSIAILADGVPLNDPLTGAFNLSLYPTEQIERIEVIPATRAFLYARGASGGAVNLVSKSKKALIPRSRIRYSEGANGYGFIDGTVSQDVVRGLNVTAGAQHVTYEKRFENSAYDAWTTHLKARYNISSEVNAFASLLVNGTELGLNGGVDPATPDSARFDELLATVVNTDAYEKITRTDLQAGVAFRPAFDTSSVHTITLFHSSALREYRDEENRSVPNGITAADDHRTEWLGARWLFERSFSDGMDLQLGAEAVRRAVVASPATGGLRATSVAALGRVTLRPVCGLELSGYARADHESSKWRLGTGADAVAYLTPSLSVNAGFSRSYRMLTFLEEAWNGGVVSGDPSEYFREPPERHDLVEAGVRLSSGPNTLALTLYRRVVRDASILRFHPGAIRPYTYDFAGREALSGLSLEGRARIAWLSLEGRLEELDRGRTTTAGLPDWWAECGAYFLDSVVNGHLRLKAGVRASAAAAFTADAFDERELLFTSGAAVRPAGSFDVVIIAAIGDATIHLLWENVTNRERLTTYLYPMDGRAFRFGVNWDFLN